MCLLIFTKNGPPGCVDQEEPDREGGRAKCQQLTN